MTAPDAQRPDFDVVILGVVRVALKNEVIAIGQKNGPTVCFFARRQLRHRPWSSAVRVDPKQRADTLTAEDDDAVTIPRTSPTQRRVADDLRRSAGERDPFQFSLREEADRLSIRRPEGMKRAVRAGQFTRLRSIKLADPKGSCRFRSRRAAAAFGNQRDRTPIRRERRMTERVEAVC